MKSQGQKGKRGQKTMILSTTVRVRFFCLQVQLDESKNLLSCVYLCKILETIFCADQLISKAVSQELSQDEGLRY